MGASVAREGEVGKESHDQRGQHDAAL